MSIKRGSKQSGFTLVELLVVMGLLGIILGLTVVNMFKPQTDASLEGVVAPLVADIKAQQLRAMAGDSGSDGVTEPFGIRIQPNEYTMFKDAAYSAGSADNFSVSINAGITLSTNLPSSQVVFSKGSGDVSGFSAAANTITVTNSAGSSKVLTINRYGSVAIN